MFSVEPVGPEPAADLANLVFVKADCCFALFAHVGKPSRGGAALQARHRLLSISPFQGKNNARMNDISLRRFVTDAESVKFLSPWTLEEWLCRPDIVPNQHLLLVRANMDPYRSHPFHKHPTREELIYVISGQAEQWVGREYRILKAGEMAFIPTGEIHGTFNPFAEKLIFLAILSPAKADEPAVVDVSADEPWASIRKGMPAVK